MNKKMRPLIKWTGGKYKEFTLFAHHIPKFERYIEPFFGGGGVFFALQPQVPSFINDKSKDLINFYRQIGEEAFKTELLNYAHAWTELGKLNAILWQKCNQAFIDFIYKGKEIDQLSELLKENLIVQSKKQRVLGNKAFIVDERLFEKTLLASCFDKAKRIKRIAEREKRVFNEKELAVHFETGLRSGFYLFVRSLLNQYHKQILSLTSEKAVANWYFVREFCYGSMFRYNAKGEFNIPYGGIAYNKKNLAQKIKNISSETCTSLFKQARIHNEDFEVFLSQIDLKANDFIFLDPPYDSEFSEYDQNAFTQQDQKRLADFLIACPAKWMVVIKETDFIRQIYTHSKVKLKPFNKSYTYNVRGRNKRAVTHLIITNY